MSKCEGTDSDAAMENRQLREAILDDKRVTQLYCKYKVELADGGIGVVVLDDQHAREHIRHCLNSMKKFRSYKPRKVVEEVSYLTRYQHHFMLLVHVGQRNSKRRLVPREQRTTLI